MRYELIAIGVMLYLVNDTADSTHKWITKDEMLADIFTDPIFDDIK